MQLLFGGKTVHFAFYVPNNVDSKTQPRLARDYNCAAILRASELIIIDEISTLHKDVFNYVNRTLQYLYDGTSNATVPFAGKVVVIGGDWKQTLPVVKGQMYAQYVTSVKNHELFSHFKVHRLTQNMRYNAS